MNNKLKDILDQFELDWGYFKLRCHKYLPNGEKLSAGWITEKDVKKYIQMACVEYARSKAPKEENEFCKECGRPKHERAMMLQRIDQDLQSLNN